MQKYVNNLIIEGILTIKYIVIGVLMVNFHSVFHFQWAIVSAIAYLWVNELHFSKCYKVLILICAGMVLEPGERKIK